MIAKQDSAALNNLVDLKGFRRKKTVVEGLSRGRKPLFISFSDKTINGGSRISDFGEKIQSIRESLNRVNVLLSSVGNIERSQTK